MKRNELMNLYAIEYETNPRTGKPRRVARYIGEWFETDRDLIKRLRPIETVLWLAALIAFLTAGLTSVAAQRSLLVLPFYAFTLLGLFRSASALIALWRLPERFDEVQKQECFHDGPGAMTALAVCGALWFAGDVIFLAADGRMVVSMAKEILFGACGAVTAIAGLCGYRLWKRVPVRTVPKEKDYDGEKDRQTGEL